jgi:hypothetical protein
MDTSIFEWAVITSLWIIIALLGQISTAIALREISALVA